MTYILFNHLFYSKLFIYIAIVNKMYLLYSYITLCATTTTATYREYNFVFK